MHAQGHYCGCPTKNGGISATKYKNPYLLLDRIICGRKDIPIIYAMQRINLLLFHVASWDDVNPLYWYFNLVCLYWLV